MAGLKGTQYDLYQERLFNTPSYPVFISGRAARCGVWRIRPDDRAAGITRGAMPDGATPDVDTARTMGLGTRVRG
jgi:hypothetical protein